jgi:uncharacterized protein YceK
MRINIPNFGAVMKKIVVVLCLLILSGCSAVPSVQLKKEDFEKLNTLSVEASEHDNSMLVVVGKAKMQWAGGYAAVADVGGTGLKASTLEFLEANEINFNDIVTKQFIEKIREDNLDIELDEKSKNKLVFTINVVVLGIVHGFSDEYTSGFNISGQLFDGSGKLIWSCNPTKGFAEHFSKPSLTLKEIFSSKESALKFFSAESDSMVQKLYDDFKNNLI